MSKKSTTIATLEERVERKRAALRRRDELKELIHEAASSVSKLEVERREIEWRLSGVPDVPHMAELRERLQAQIGQINGALEQALSLDGDLQAELNELEYRTIPGTLQATTLADIIPHQDEINAALSSLQRLQQLVGEQRAIIQQANGALAPVQDRSGERAEVLANIATGDADHKALVGLDALIASEHNDFAARQAEIAPVIERATQTIAGLENKIAELQTTADELKQKTPFVLEQYLNSEIARTLGDYMAHANAVKEAFARVVALEQLLKNATGWKGRMVMPRLLKLPCPALEEYRDMVAAKNEQDVLFNADSIYMSPSIYEAAKEEIVGQMRGQGCDLL